MHSTVWADRILIDSLRRKTQPISVDRRCLDGDEEKDNDEARSRAKG